MNDKRHKEVTDRMRERLKEFADTSDDFYKIAFAYKGAFGSEDPLMKEFSELVWGIPRKESKE